MKLLTNGQKCTSLYSRLNGDERRTYARHCACTARSSHQEGCCQDVPKGRGVRFFSGGVSHRSGRQPEGRGDFSAPSGQRSWRQAQTRHGRRRRAMPEHAGHPCRTSQAASAVRPELRRCPGPAQLGAQMPLRQEWPRLRGWHGAAERWPAQRSDRSAHPALWHLLRLASQRCLKLPLYSDKEGALVGIFFFCYAFRDYDKA